jgi:hypothetical protein
VTKLMEKQQQTQYDDKLDYDQNYGHVVTLYLFQN